MSFSLVIRVKCDIIWCHHQGKSTTWCWGWSRHSASEQQASVQLWLCPGGRSAVRRGGELCTQLPAQTDLLSRGRNAHRQGNEYRNKRCWIVKHSEENMSRQGDGKELGRKTSHSLPEEEMVEPRPSWQEGVRPGRIWKRHFLNRRTGKCHVPVGQQSPGECGWEASVAIERVGRRWPWGRQVALWRLRYYCVPFCPSSQIWPQAGTSLSPLPYNLAWES